MDVLTREQVEQREHEMLSPQATFADGANTRANPEEPDPLRTCFQRDRDRIIHSKGFRRLAHKTQVFLAPEGDHYRTRLIHTMEVTQIARDVARSLRLNEDLTEAIGLGHDLGHTPFGHTGEATLCQALAAYRGISSDDPCVRTLFRHNEQSVRVLQFIEKDGVGLNLTSQVLDGIRCHSGNLRAATPEGRIVAISDRIAYVNHDIDDAMRANLLSESDLPPAACRVLGYSSTERISTLVRDLVSTSVEEGDIRMSPTVYESMMDLRQFLFDHIYTRSDAKVEEPKANALVYELFDYFIDHLDELPDEYRIHDADHPEIQVCDFISCMTDRFAIRTFEELRVPHAWRLGKELS